MHALLQLPTPTPASFFAVQVVPLLPHVQSNVIPFGVPLTRHVPAPVSSQFAVYVFPPHFLNCEHVSEASGPPPELPP